MVNKDISTDVAKVMACGDEIRAEKQSRRSGVIKRAGRAVRQAVDAVLGQERYKAKYDADGFEVMDSRPLAAAIKISRPPTIQEQVARLVRSEQFSQAMTARGRETFDESEDFDVDDDIHPMDPRTPYEDAADDRIEEDNVVLRRGMSRDDVSDLPGQKRGKEKGKPPSAGQGSKKGVSPSDDDPAPHNQD